MRTIALSSLILGITLVTVGCTGYSCNFVLNNNSKVEVETRENLILPAEGISKLKVSTYNGFISLTGDEMATEFRVDIAKKAFGRNEAEAQSAMKEIVIVTDADGDTQELRWKWQDKDKARDHKWNASVSFTIILPVNMETRCETYNGRVAIAKIAGDSKIKTYNGSITMESHEGDIDLETYNGKIDSTSLSSNFEIESYNGNVTSNLRAASILDGNVKTYNGRIRLNIDGEPSTRIKASVHNGRINAKNDLLKDEHKNKRQYEGVIGSGEGDVILETYNGSIDIL